MVINLSKLNRPKKQLATCSKRPKKPLAARDSLVLQNLGLCYTLAGRFVTPGVEFTDLVQLGVLGLIDAANGFDEELGYQFSTYATSAILGRLREGINQIKGIVHVPRVTRYAASQFRENDGLALHSITTNRRQLLIRAKAAESVGYLSEKVKSEDSGTLEDVLLDRAEPPVYNRDEIEMLHSYLGRLTKREREVVSMCFGLEPYTQMTLEKIGKKLGCSKERVRQIRNRAVDMLRMFYEREL